MDTKITKVLKVTNASPIKNKLQTDKETNNKKNNKKKKKRKRKKSKIIYEYV